MPDRRFENLLAGETGLFTAPNSTLTGCRTSEDITGMNTLPLVLDSARDFHISGDLIACVNNIYSSQSSGRWKELELYQTPNGDYVCLEIWRTVLNGKHDQYWLTTCRDLKTAREFFGNNCLAGDLFDEISTDPLKTIT